MVIGLIADIHANLPALEAVLAAMRKHHPDRIISLGDQINLGPCPRETLHLLKDENVTCLHGNHERYVLSAMAKDPAYDGANFASLRFNAQRLNAQEITFPKMLQQDGVTFCHAMPEDDRFPMFDPPKALPLLLRMSAEQPMHIVCGHGHNPTSLVRGAMTLHSIGSCGCMDDGPAGVTSYALLTTEANAFALRPYHIAYDTARHRALFAQSGMADECPIMAHIICLQMERNQDYLVDFVTRARALSTARGEAAISLDTWQDTDKIFPWPDGIGTAAFWRNATK